MALQMDPERRRKLLELARWNREWEERHQIDDADHTVDGSDGPKRRSPTPEQEAEYHRRADEIMGIDPDTGLYRG
ncbi:hypothetical protein [Plantactinospora sp. GCM10030261]|uniref:hypothetical protein n=1 Tax=Plantactinospora sp. GCM10030261 TaxID=3273420 RepID=UPI003606C659